MNRYFALLFGCSLGLSAQEPTHPWTRLFPQPTENHLYAVHQVEADRIWVGGESGTLLGTLDDGKTWIDATRGIQGIGGTTFIDIHFPARDTGYALGTAGVLLGTRDGGLTWSRLPVGSGTGLNAVRFVNGKTGFLAGDSGTLLTTADAGASWTPVATRARLELTALRFPARDTGFMVGGGTLLRSLDGGATWDSLSVPGAANLQHLSFPTSRTGYACGRGGDLYQTQDAGETWEQIFHGFIGDVAGMDFTSPEVGVLVGNGFESLHTSDGGASWREEVRPDYLHAVHRSIAVGRFGMIDRFYGRTLSFGTKNQGLNAVQFVDASVGYAVGGATGGDQGLLKTVNGGRSWTYLGEPRLGYDALQFLDRTTGYVLVSDYCGAPNRILRTWNGGEAWMEIFTHTFTNCEETLRAIHFVGTDTGFAVGGGGTIFRSTILEDGSWSFVREPSGTTESLASVHFPTKDTGFCAGTRGIILRSVDSGKTWERQATGVVGDLTAIRFADARSGIAVGKDGLILSTADGGVTWALRQGITTADLLSLTALSKDVWHAGGESGTLLESTDGGRTWEGIGPDDGMRIMGVSFPKAGLGFAVGRGKYGGRILRYDSPGPSPVPTFQEPADQALHVPRAPMISWSPVVGASAYHLQVSLDPAFAAPAAEDSTLAVSFRVTGPLLPRTQYHVRVRAKVGGAWQAWTAARRFTTEPEGPTGPALGAPAAGVRGLPVTSVFTWAPDAEAFGYHLQVARDSLFSSPVAEDSALAVAFRVVGPLDSGKAHFWRVRVRKVAGWGGWSAVRSFSTAGIQPGRVTLLSPYPGEPFRADSITFRWSAAAGNPVAYAVEWSRDSLFREALADSSVADTLKAVKLAIPGGGPAGGRFWWRVTALNEAGWGERSAEGHFTVQIPSTVLWPSDPILVGGPLGSVLRLRVERPTVLAMRQMDLRGRVLSPGVEHRLDAGRHAIALRSEGMAAGVRILEIRMDGKALRLKMPMVAP